METPIFASGADYLAFVDTFCALLDSQLLEFEAQAQDPSQLHSIMFRLPALISLVNTVGYLRGQDDLFLNVRPMTDNQQHLYELEQQFETRLGALIQLVLDSHLRDQYIERLQQYYVTTRSGQLAS